MKAQLVLVFALVVASVVIGAEDSVDEDCRALFKLNFPAGYLDQFTLGPFVNLTAMVPIINNSQIDCNNYCSLYFGFFAPAIKPAERMTVANQFKEVPETCCCAKKITNKPDEAQTATEQ